MVRRNPIELGRLRDENSDLERETRRQRGIIQELETRLAGMSSTAAKAMTESGEAPCGGCREVVAVVDAYRCFHCEIWFCRDCGRDHFR
jgi:hypothetical protein